MESLFGSMDDQMGDNWMDAPKRSEKQDAEEEATKRSSSGKNFASDLQSFLQEAFDDSIERQLEERQKRDHAVPAKPSVKKKRRRPMAGLDALIRSTVDPQPGSDKDDNRPKRITLSFDPVKLEKLKDIARSQRTLLRDIIDEIVEEYLNKVESKS